MPDRSQDGSDSMSPPALEAAARSWPRATSMPAWAACRALVRAMIVRVPVTWLTTIGTSAALNDRPTSVTSSAMGIEPWSRVC